MALEIRQQLKLSQQLVMTPQLQQAIKLLQLSRMELIEMVQQELEENPILDEGQETFEEREAEPAGEAEESSAESSGENEISEVKGEGEGLNDIDWQTYLEGYNLGGPGADYSLDEDERPSYENLLTKKSTLTDHLMWQLSLARIDEGVRAIATEIIGNLDEDGFLKAGLEDIAAATGAELPLIEKTLRYLQEFDPCGVAARSLQECLLRQIEALGMGETLAAVMLREHVEDMENRRFQAIARSLGVTLDEVLEAAKVISGLDPRPGRRYNQDDIQYITPDIFVYKVGDEFVVVLNDDGLPSLRINAFYRSALSEGSRIDGKASEYIQDKMRSALWLIKSIHQRQRTIYRVTKSIVKFQREFFEKGIDYLRPLVLRDVAEDIEMHESTISRVTTNKYVQTPQGLFELKYFFNSGISTGGGEAIASESVKSRIKDMVAAENPKKPLSDQRIVEMLAEENIHIARRTVTKYREMLGIGSSTERKRLF